MYLSVWMNEYLFALLVLEKERTCTMMITESIVCTKNRKKEKGVFKRKEYLVNTASLWLYLILLALSVIYCYGPFITKLQAR